MDLLFDLVQEYTGTHGLLAGVFVGLALGLISCLATLAIQWLMGR
jgi:hypothetical protein